MSVLFQLLNRLLNRLRGRRGDDRPRTPAEARDERLSAYLDDELDDAEQAEVERELAGDTTLRDNLAELRGVRSALGALGEVRAPRSFALEVPASQARPAGGPTGLPRIELALRIGAVATAFLFVVVFTGDVAGIGGSAPRTQVEEQRSSLLEAGDAGGGGGLAAAVLAPEDGAEGDSATAETQPADLDADGGRPQAADGETSAASDGDEGAPTAPSTGGAVAPAVRPATTDGDDAASDDAADAPAPGRTPDRTMESTAPDADDEKPRSPAPEAAPLTASAEDDGDAALRAAEAALLLAAIVLTIAAALRWRRRRQY